MANDMVTGKKRNIGLLGRELRQFRKIKLLSSNVEMRVDPSRWIQIAGSKEFDATSTRFLRVSRHKTEANRFLVHGMRSTLRGKTAEVDAEVYELAAAAEVLPSVIAQVAEHCGVESLVAQVKLP